MTKFLTVGQAIDAVREGKSVEYLYEGNPGNHNPLQWDEKLGLVDCHGHFNMGGEYTFYLTPEPLAECWVNIYSDMSPVYHPSEHKARANECGALRVAVHMREVREEETI